MVVLIEYCKFIFMFWQKYVLSGREKKLLTGAK